MILTKVSSLVSKGILSGFQKTFSLEFRKCFDISISKKLYKQIQFFRKTKNSEMTRHARNSTAGSVYTYHEKKKDGTD